MGHAGLERALGGELVGEAVGEGIREGHAHLEDVGAVAGEGQQDVGRGGGIGVAGADVADERGAALGLAAGECVLEATHGRMEAGRGRGGKEKEGDIGDCGFAASRLHGGSGWLNRLMA